MNPTHHRVFPFLLGFAALTAASTAQAPQLPADRSAGAAAIDVARCKQWLHTLAGPEFEGRGTGQPGYQKAADYVAAHFESLGLEPRGEEGSFFQHVPWQQTVVSKASLSFEAAAGDTLLIPNERLVGSASDAMQAAGAVTLLRVVVPETGDGDSARRLPEIPGLDAVDVKGRVVVAVVEATSGQTSSEALGRFAVSRALQGKEPAALVFASPTKVGGGLAGRRGMGRRGGGNPAADARGRQPLDVTFGGDDFAALLRAAGMDEKAWQKSPLASEVPLTAAIDVAVATSNAPAMNVFAVLPGSDPKLRHEYVVIGSHLDHLGKSGDTIRPGADDDGSGTTGVMAVAQMFAKNPQKPRRSVLFVCFSGEESGLVGSGYFANNCPVPLASIVAELQMDMIGRDEEEAMDGGRRVNVGETAEQNRNSLHLVGTQKLSRSLHELCLAANGRAGFDLEYDQEDMFGRSDHANFARHGVPIAFFFTGLHRDYHQPTDTADKIHYEKLLRIAIYVYDIAFELGTQDGRPEVDEDLWQEFRGGRRNRASEQPAAPLKKR
jgi:hypothetical protein